MKSLKTTQILSHQFVLNDPLHQLFDAIHSISVQGYDEQRRVIYWNKGSELLYGYTKEYATGKKLEELIIPPPMQDAVIDAHREWLISDIEIPAAELTLQHQNGSNVTVFSSHVMFTNQHGVKQMYCIDIDLSDVKQAQAQAMDKQQMLEKVFEAIPDLYFLLKPDGTIVDYHANDLSNLHLQPEQFLNKSMFSVLPYTVAKMFKDNIQELLIHKGNVCFEYELLVPKGVLYFEARVSYLHHSDQVMVIIRDITEQHESNKLIRKQAYYDSLTLLPNRFYSLKRLTQLINTASEKNTLAAVIFIDLDDFKKVNDTLGHEIGDSLLISAANKLSQIVNENATVGRLGGDEFIILQSELHSKKQLDAIVTRLLKSFRTPFEIDGRELLLTLSIGVALYPDNGVTASDLLRHADTAMYQAKALGRNTYACFTSEMNTAIKRRLAIEEQMHVALEKNEFELYFQPKCDAKTLKIIGAEALLRWNNSVLGKVMPDEFIPLAEQTGLIIPIGKFVIEQALAFLTQWQVSSQQNYSMAINLSPSQFRDSELLSFIASTLEKTGVSAKNVELEITEGVLMSVQTNITESLHALNKLGIKLSMDDFGTGYSSLSYLRQYPFEVLKIDRSFICGITENQEDYSLVKATIAMSHSLGLSVVAEGVETSAQQKLLAELNCDLIQGYYFSKPLPALQLLDFKAL
ncbi:bifunctional diguanylate cyclase/phosphodiesterase [Pseudoalteromonas sp. S2893]|uniref:sensor domain-containing protein n=1 Tax=Pseudoalteromonas sp. S2893 TaxID=579530 RepID=UPI00110A1033|nr:bifunctional diguanylate cyclase/phosphodiesterase [Pseudoalteromonas sp. S2893]TMP18465.1 GGDEF domain-containing protein [Pseudoalteromonas sp. S2893]